MNLLQKKIIFTLFVVLIFIIGNQIELPIIPYETDNIPKGLNVYLFTLGITPWMSAQILVRVIYLGREQKVSSKRNIYIYILTLIIGMIQSLGMLSVGPSWEVLVYFILPSTVVLLAGSFILIFIAQCNVEYGLGGQSIMFLLNILLSKKSLLSNFQNLTTSDSIAIAFIMFWSLLSIYIMVILDKAEYRIAVNRVSINSSRIKDSYVPLKLNPSGGMAFMYGFSIISLSKYLILFLSKIFSNKELFTTLSLFTDLTNWRGSLYYVIILFLMTILFTFFNFDIEEFSNNLRKTGDYLINIRPGRATQVFLKNTLLCLGVFSAFQICILVGTPLFFGYLFNFPTDIMTVPGMFLMTSGMILTMNQEIVTIRTVKEYQPLL
ncbi:TPA: hypothetical protein U1C34_001958 [Streptococcus suis]|nr:hypothetical protein [Streptococcus suis]HEM3627374.1 hypothetical protein [Streptococcus suis]HEM3632006.1 hypothetical protein [Streptococcus suis]HEM3701042.1 hypothetical protein [Streptococcus suis]HEM3715964.1 hypothetical protein [Streptococcus suis]